MKIYETDIRLDECIQLIQESIPKQEGDVEFSVQKNRVEISIKHIMRKFIFWRRGSFFRRSEIKIPVIFYGKLSQSGTHTILSGSFQIASAWKMLCTLSSFGLLLSAGSILGRMSFGRISFVDNAISELLSYYGFTLLFFLTIPLIKYTNRNDEKLILLFLESKLNFRPKKEIIQFSQSDITIIVALLTAHILGFIWGTFF